jgi:parvulin-like peptidyl-prolyl isomerase
MTFRAKPVVKRGGRSSWESRDRRNFYLNLGFGLVVVVAIAVLLIAIAFNYYNENLAPVGSVDGQAISKSELRDRVDVETWRIDEAERRLRTQTVAGRLTQAQADVQQQLLDQQREQVVGIALERIIDNRVQARLADEEGIAITDADIDARLEEEATTPESRRVWVIESAPEVSDGALEPTAEQIAAAKAKAEAALRDLQAGKPWDDVAKTVSTDASTAQQAGDLGWLQADDTQADEAFLAAVFAAEAESPTAVIEGADGIFRIGRASEIAPESVDGAYTDKLINDGIDVPAYREVVRGDVIRRKLEDKVVADATKPGPQRDVQEIFIAEDEAEVPASGVKVRHILYSPNDDPGAASSGEIPDDDAAWATAKAAADAAYAKLRTDPSQFDTIARTESDETSALGVTGSGGKLPGYVTEDSGYVDSFKQAVLAPGLTDGQVLAPFKSEFGWHVVQVMAHPPALAQLEAIKAKADAGTDFGALARDNSEADNAGAGGAMGWIAKAQVAPELAAGMFLTEIGKVSDIVTIPGDGHYLYKILKEETRTPEGRQLEEIRASAFSDWYQEKKDAAQIDRDDAFLVSE